MSQLLKEANALCQKVYGQSYHEIFGFDSTDDEEIKQNILVVRRKEKFIIEDVPEPVVIHKTLNFLDIWRGYWKSVIVDQPIICDLYCLCAISQLLKHITVIKTGGVEDDIRIHICVIMPSGTGKSEGNDVLALFAKSVGLIYGVVDKYNDASLVGSVSRQAIDYNTKHHLRPGDDDYKDPDDKGILRKSDFVVFDEGENILKTNPATEGAQRYLQKAMNRHMSESNFITNTLVGHMNGGYPDCSAVITSYYLDEFQETLLDRGLLQRMIVYIQEESYDVRTNIINSIIDGIPSFDEDPAEAAPYITSMRKSRTGYITSMEKEGKKLREYHRNTSVISIKSDAKYVIADGVNELRDLMPFLMGQRQVWESMVTRMTVNLLKVAAVHALINYRHYIVKEDAMYASNLMINTMKSMGFFLKENVSTKSDKRTLSLYNVLRKNYIGDKKTMDEWIDLCAQKFSISSLKSSMFIKTLIENKKMSETVLDGKKVYIIK